MQDDFFIESSALAKRYKQEAGSNWMDKLFESKNGRLFYLNITILEVQKLIHRLRFHPQSEAGGIERQIDDQTFRELLAQSSGDFLNMQVIQLTQAMLNRATAILRDHWIASSIDLLQIAAYLEVRETYPKTKFVCADGRLNEIIEQVVPNVVINPVTGAALDGLVSSIRNDIAERAVALV